MKARRLRFSSAMSSDSGLNPSRFSNCRNSCCERVHRTSKRVPSHSIQRGVVPFLKVRSNARHTYQKTPEKGNTGTLALISHLFLICLVQSAKFFAEHLFGGCCLGSTDKYLRSSHQASSKHTHDQAHSQRAQARRTRTQETLERLSWVIGYAVRSTLTFDSSTCDVTSTWAVLMLVTSLS
jgi:hypothetical protein